MSGYRQPPPDPQNMPPPNFPPRGMPRDQGISGNPMFNRPMMPRMPPGYPPMDMPPGFPPIPGQEQGLPMGYQSSSPLHNPGLPPGYPNHMGGHPMTRPPQNVQQGFNHNSNQALAQQNFHPQQHPPQHNHHQRGAYQNHPPHQPHPNDFNQHLHHQQPPQHRSQPPNHRQQHPNTMMNHQFHPQQQQSPNASDFHPQQQHHNAMGPSGVQQEFHPMHSANSIANEYHPHQQQQHMHQQQQYRPDFSQHHHQDAHQGMSHHDFRHHQGGREQQQGGMMGAGPFMDHQGMAGLHGLMGEHMIGQAMEDHLLGGGDAYSQAHMMQMYGDPNLQDLGEGDFM